MSGLTGTLSSSDDAPDVLAGVAGLTDEIDLPFPGLNSGGDGSVEFGKGLVPLAGGLPQLLHGVVDGFAHKDRMTHLVGLVQLTASRMWPRVCGMSTSAPAVGTKVRADTTTPSAVAVIIEVTALDGENPKGWFVWGYRQGVRNAGRRQTMFPRLYFVAKS